ncbi:hypothetical protein ACFSM5_21160 [Lacibacterium aquatile]|uniref:Lipoprotein n=1 Tax=Lacibacterium aquatile TaxID=1168082 RepID=A0ABW5DY13_9PROT
MKNILALPLPAALFLAGCVPGNDAPTTSATTPAAVAQVVPRTCSAIRATIVVDHGRAPGVEAVEKTASNSGCFTVLPSVALSTSNVKYVLTVSRDSGVSNNGSGVAKGAASIGLAHIPFVGAIAGAAIPTSIDIQEAIRMDLKEIATGKILGSGSAQYGYSKTTYETAQNRLEADNPALVEALNQVIVGAEPALIAAATPPAPPPKPPVKTPPKKKPVAPAS